MITLSEMFTWSSSVFTSVLVLRRHSNRNTVQLGLTVVIKQETNTMNYCIPPATNYVD